MAEEDIPDLDGGGSSGSGSRGNAAPRVIAMVTIFHVHDDLNPTQREPTHAMLAFVVTNADQKLMLQPFIPSGSPAEEEEEEEEEGGAVAEVEEGGRERSETDIVGDNRNAKDSQEDDEGKNRRAIISSRDDVDAPEISSGVDPNGIGDADSALPCSDTSLDLATPSSLTLQSSSDSKPANVSSSSSSSSSSSNQSSTSVRRPDNCSVCLTLPVTVVTLPCRHAAVCQRCLRRLRDKRCPVCRGVIQTHFDLDVS